MKYLITFSYNGNYFKGYQKQKNLKTVQGCLEKYLTMLNDNEVVVTSSGRTDVYVHAINAKAHFTLDKNMEGPDHLASTEPDDFKEMVNAIRNVESCLGDGVKQPSVDEVKISKVVLKRIVAKHKISSGQIITADDICVKRSATGIPSYAWDLVVGTVARKNFSTDEGIVF